MFETALNLFGFVFIFVPLTTIIGLVRSLSLLFASSLIHLARKKICSRTRLSVEHPRFSPSSFMGFLSHGTEK